MMISEVRTVVIVVVLAAPFVRGDSIEESLTELRKSAAEYNQIATTVQAKVKSVSFYSSKARDKVETTEELTIKQNKSCALLIRKQRQGESERETVHAINSRYGFVLTKNNDGWLLSEIHLDQPSKVRVSPNKLLLDDIRSWAAAHFVAMAPGTPMLIDLIAEPSFKVKKVESVKRQGEELQALHFSYQTVVSKTPIAADGVMFFDAGRHWIQRAVECRQHFADPATTTVEFEYDGRIGELPRLVRQHIRTTVNERSGGVGLSETERSFELSIEPDVPESEFTLSAFGLPEPRGIAWDHPSRIGWWVGGAGVLVVVIGVIMRKRVLARKANVAA